MTGSPTRPPLKLRKRSASGKGELECQHNRSWPAETETAKRLEQLLDGWRAKYPDVPVSQDLVHGHPGRALAGLSARADLVVLGWRSAHHGPGSVMHAVLSHAHGPVVTVPS